LQFVGVLAAVVATVSLGLVTAAQGADSSWTVTQIGEPGFWASDLNDNGVVVGYVGGPDYHAVSWSNGTTTVLDTPEKTIRSLASAINNLGQIVGSVTVQQEAGVRTEAVLWDANGGYTLLGFLNNGTFSEALDINDLGQVVGVASPAGGTYTAVLWTADGAVALPVPAAPPCPPGGCGFITTTSFAQAINNHGAIVGNISYPYQPQNAVMWAPDAAPVFLPPLAGKNAAASDINDSRMIVGNSYGGASYASNATVWIDGNLTDLGTGYATAINHTGMIVGQLSDAAGLRHAYVWGEGFVGTPLPTPEGDVETIAGGVNAGGQVIGASRQSGTWRAVMWTRTTDTDAPVITVPDPLTQDATGPGGTTVNFTVAATDDNPANPTVTCAPPSGSGFPIATTAVICTATDDAGNTATASFTVTVKGAPEQLADLLGAVTGLGPGTSLADKVKAAQSAYAAGHQARTCEILKAFINQMNALPVKIIPADTASDLIADAQRIRAVLGC
jgi:uncharacterized membrane protein